MSAVRGHLLNRLLRDLPSGYLVDTAWLRERGLSASSVRDYVKRDWLERVGPRLYRRDSANDTSPLRWETTLLSLMNLLNEPLHVGGLTALELAGYWHYAIVGRRRLWIYSDSQRTRTLLNRLTLDADPVVRSRKLFSEPELGVATRALDLVTGSLGPEMLAGDKSPVSHLQLLRASSLERAILETLDEVPGTVSFDHAAELFEGLTTLRPRLATALLHACRSVKAKRLFLYFASQHSYAWVRSVRREEVDIGSGKRQIVIGGRLDPDYLITVPHERGLGARRRKP
jgi:hypothetical protein